MLDLRWIMVTGLSLLMFLVSFNPAFAFLAYISNEKGNSISVIDTDKMETVATIKTGQRPRGIEVTATVNSSSSHSATTTRFRSSTPRPATMPANCRPVRTPNNLRSIRLESCSTSPTKTIRW